MMKCVNFEIIIFNKQHCQQEINGNSINQKSTC